MWRCWVVLQKRQLKPQLLELYKVYIQFNFGWSGLLYGLWWGNTLQQQIYLPTPDQSLFLFMLSRHETQQYLLYLRTQRRVLVRLLWCNTNRINCIGFKWNKIKIRSDRRPVYPKSMLILHINKDFHVYTPVMLSGERCSTGSRNNFASLVRSAFANACFT